MRWIGFLFLLLPLNSVGGQSVDSYPRINSVSSVTIVDNFLYFNLSRVIPQDSFATWWAEMEACTKIRKPFEGMSWWVATGLYNVAEKFSAWGVYYPVPPEIVVVQNQKLPQLEHTVKHEILHHLIQNTDHQEETFVRCLPTLPE